ncbi:phosphopyruvate hydratase [Planctomyces sp. SH-PL62]|uniref:phosphopyruvate hydratase n=1 Tax=Planctomyces sp. SH-PL62 TaxID=1636152 RepID=UPI00078C6AEA|nr:phosphopyruvate hydratase [Planctomyces sp. SH-PL62]AMV39323.1 Enolase [Planctomyces sp. SH-PL62]
MPTLRSLKARQVLDSRGRPTVEVDAFASNGARGTAIVPSGASTGRHEALELRDADPAHYGGLGVSKAVANIHSTIAPALLDMDLDDQRAVDAALIALDGTPNKGRLGANALLGVSLAVAHASAASRGEELFLHLNRLWKARAKGLGDAVPQEPTLPLPMVNMISGGLHAGRNLDIQDVLFIPIGAESYSQALETIVAMYRAVGQVLAKLGMESTLVGDEGGYGPRLSGDEQALEIVVEAMNLCGLTPGEQGAIALDVASTHFFDESSRTYRFSATGSRPLDAGAMIELLARWTERYPIVSIEDGLAEDDWEGWKALTDRLGSKVQLIGDDLFVTQTARLGRGIENGAGNAVLIKVNQVGTLSETLDALETARRSGFRPIVSARSGETEDATIADLAVGTAAGQIKIGSVARSERLAKYNRLLRIEEALGRDARFAGRATLP